MVEGRNLPVSGGIALVPMIEFFNPSGELVGPTIGSSTIPISLVVETVWSTILQSRVCKPYRPSCYKLARRAIALRLGGNTLFV